MLVRECMTTDPIVATPSMTLREVARQMRDGDFGFMPVGENEQLMGVVTDRDLVIRGLAVGRDPDEMQIHEVMSEDVEYCFEDQSLDEVIDELGEEQIRRLPVLSRDGERLVGILSLGDIALSEEFEDETAEALRDISQPGQDQLRQ